MNSSVLNGQYIADTSEIGVPLFLELHSGPSHWMGAYGPLIAVYWLSDIDGAVCRALPKVTKEFCSKLREPKVAVVSVTFNCTRAPDTEAREGLAALARDTDHYVQRVAVVRESEGFVSSVVASIVAGIDMVSRRTNSVHRCFRKIDDAVPWASAELPDFCVGQISVQEAIEVLNRRLAVMKVRGNVASSLPAAPVRNRASAPSKPSPNDVGASER